jgi:hypothetical protein
MHTLASLFLFFFSLSLSLSQMVNAGERMTTIFIKVVAAYFFFGSQNCILFLVRKHCCLSVPLHCQFPNSENL